MAARPTPGLSVPTGGPERIPSLPNVPLSDELSPVGPLAAVGLGAMALAPLLADLGRPTTPLARTGGSGLVLPTQFGPGDEILATRPAGMGVAYQKVLLPGETEALLSAQVTTVRGLIHPLDQIRELRTPDEIRVALGLDVTLTDEHGDPVAAYGPGVPDIDVLRFTGIRDADLVIPVQADVERPDSTIPTLVREHVRPWTGSGEAPGSHSDRLIEEFEILGELCQPVPHLAELWRLGADGSAEHLGTFNARAGVWSGTRAHAAPRPGTAEENGHLALIAGPPPQRYPTTNLTAHEQVLVSDHAPDSAGFESTADGRWRRVVPVGEPSATIAAVTLAQWRGARVSVLHRTGTQSLVDYVGGSPTEAAALGFRHLAQGQWQQRWVPTVELSDLAVWERRYPVVTAAADAGPAVASASAVGVTA